MAVTDNSTLEKPTYGPTLAPKDALRALLDRLPDTVTLEDIRYHLDVVIKVYEGEGRWPKVNSSLMTNSKNGSPKWLTG
jgi:hypothetical protein